MTRFLRLAATVAVLSASLVFSQSEAEDISSAVEKKQFDQALELATALRKEAEPGAGFEDAIYRAAKACVNEMKLEPAVGFYRMLLADFPESEHASEARAELLGCYYNLRQLEKSIALAKENLKADPESKWVEYWHFVIAQCEFRLWRFDSSKPMLEAFLKKYPDGDYAKYAKSCLDKIDPDWDVDENGLVNYTGKFEKDLRFQAAIKALPGTVDTGYRMLEDRLGIDLREKTKMVFFFRDASRGAKPGLKASTYVVGRNNVPVVVMRFYAEYAAAQPDDYRKTIIHEMKHAGFKGVMGQAYEDLPNWVKEGLAVWGSDDVQTRFQLVLCNKIAGGKDPLAILDGIEDPYHDDADYLEDVLAFEWLEKQRVGNVKEFCRQLVGGKPYRQIWAELSGMEYDKAIAAAEAHCKSRVDAALGGETYDEFMKLRRDHERSLNAGEAKSKQWLDGGGEAALKDWAKANPDHPAEPFARFCLARSLALAGRGEESRELLRQILDEDGVRCTLLDDAQFWIGISHNWAKEFPQAKTAFGVLLRDFPASHSAKQVAGKFKPAPIVTKKVEGAAAANPLEKLKMPGVKVNLEERSVDVESTVCLDEGTLELVACTRDSKEHESIVVIDAKALHIHTALLLLGAKNGQPAMRRQIGEGDDKRWVDLPPRGAPVDVSLVFKGADGKMKELPISKFIMSADWEGESDEEKKRFPTDRFLFAGSHLVSDGPGPRTYLSDRSGNVISITTFGDELLCLPEVRSHENGALLWQVDSTLLPKVESKVILRLRPVQTKKKKEKP